jgi:flavin-binding protein dodecin
VTAIWTNVGDGWRLLAPVGFPDEAALHRLVEEAPQLLPLSGSPRLVVLGHEVPLGGGYADIIAVEPSGRVVLIEVKLAGNPEARRAVVAQILGYAASLRGTSPETLEREILRSQLIARGAESIDALAAGQDPDGSFDSETFVGGLTDSLGAGRFRLVLVLDDAPAELVRLVGYLESIAPELSIDLVTVSAYEVEGSRVLVPQRIEPERATAESVPKPAHVSKKQAYGISPEEFEQAIEEAPEKDRPALRRLYEWARVLEREGLIRLFAIRGTTGRTTLLPYLLNDDAGLITVWNNPGFYISVWRSVFERRAPGSIEKIEQLIAPAKIGNGNTIREVDEELLAALAGAYREAAQ